MLKAINAVVFDLDGTIYYGNDIIKGAKETINKMKALNKKVFYLTNNSTKSRKQIYNKLKDMGIECNIDDIYTSGYVAAVYAKNEGIKNIFILGSANLKDEFILKGIEVVEDENLAENLLIGYDTELDYEGLTKALNVALKGNTIIACNKERHFPGDKARRMPGCGAMVSAIEHCTNRKVDYLIGKPNTLMLDVLSARNRLKKDEILMVGDTYESDIVMAKKFGCKSVLIDKNCDNRDCLVINKIEELVNLIK